MAHTYNLGVIGNCSYMAYIDLSGSVMWMCMPRFDSSFAFGGLLDSERGGEFSISPASGVPTGSVKKEPTETSASRQYYLRNTNILSYRIPRRIRCLPGH